MGGQLCKQLCSRPSEQGDALDVAPKAQAKTSAPEEVIMSKHKSMGAKEVLQAAREAVAALDTAGGAERAEAWKICESAWAAALAKTK
mmetsp:Transcript_8154/g.19467  ORF Transcript_8154/g.19467 Transcript_8154/m.19467 type:complete len:88 (+) Transcript_8154:57-320(+)